MENSPGAIMWILLLIVMHAGTVRLSPVSVSRGETAHIPCVFGEGTVHNIYWKFKNSTAEIKVVNVMEGEPMYFDDYYEGRAEVDNGDKSTLILSAITVRDGGDYCCDVDRLQDTAVYDICTQLLVSGPSPVIPQCEPSECQIEGPLNADINIRCELRKISRADDVTLEWYDEREELLNSTKDEVQDDEGDGFHTLVSTATVNVLEETHFSCNSSLTTPSGTERDGVKVLVVPTIAPGSTNSPTDDPGNKADANLPAIIIPVLVAVVIFAIVVLACVLYKRKTRGSAATDHSRVGYTKAPTCGTGGASGTGGDRFNMGEKVLTDKLLFDLSKTVDITQVSPSVFSIYLDLNSAVGSAEMVNANMSGNQQAAIHKLLKLYVGENGTKADSARKLLGIFKSNSMMITAEHLEEAMKDEMPQSLPSPPTTAPAIVELEKKPQPITSDHCTRSADSTAGLTTKGGDKKKLTESFIAELSKSIGNPANLLDLGLKLGFQESQVNIYRQTNQRNEDWSGTRKILFDWKRKTSKKDQIPHLKTALTESGFAELADQL